MKIIVFFCLLTLSYSCSDTQKISCETYISNFFKLTKLNDVESLEIIDVHKHQREGVYSFMARMDFKKSHYENLLKKEKFPLAVKVELVEITKIPPLCNIKFKMPHMNKYMGMEMPISFYDKLNTLIKNSDGVYMNRKDSFYKTLIFHNRNTSYIIAYAWTKG